MRVTPRDYKVLKLLFENRLGTNSQISDKFYEGKNRRNSRRRLKMLTDKGLLLKAQDIYLNQKCFYHITSKGLNKIYPKQQNRGLKLKSPNPMHDYGLTQLRDIFDCSKIIHEYYTENMLLMNSNLIFSDDIFKNRDDLRPDALFVTTSKGKKFYHAIELELNQKGHIYYQNKIREYHTNEKIYSVLFISNSETIEKKVMEVEKKLFPHGRTIFYYGCFQSLLEKKLPFRFLNCFGIEWSFK